MQEETNLIEVLKRELEFLTQGGYRQPSWRPQFYFEDSPTCINYGHSQDPKRCQECALLQLVPPERRGEKVPCRHIPLNERGDTLASLYALGTQDELESILRTWLTREINKLEEAESHGKQRVGTQGSGAHS